MATVSRPNDGPSMVTAPNFSQEYANWVARGTTHVRGTHVNEYLRPGGPAEADVGKITKRFLDKLAADNIIDYKEAHSSDSILEQLHENQRSSNRTGRARKPLLGDIMSICEKTVEQHDIDVRSWIEEKGQGWIEPYESQLRDHEQKIDRNKAELLQNHNDLVATEKREIERVEAYEAKLASEQEQKEQLRKKQDAALKDFEDKTTRLEAKITETEQRHKAATDAEDHATMARDEAKARADRALEEKKTAEEELGSRYLEIERIKSDRDMAVVDCKLIAQANEDLHKDIAVLKDQVERIETTNAEGTTKFRFRIKELENELEDARNSATDLETETKELNDELEQARNGAADLENKTKELEKNILHLESEIDRTHLSSSSSKSPDSQHTPPTSIARPTGVSSTAKTSPTKMSSRTTAQFPYAEYIYPILRQVAHYRGHHYFTDYDKLEDGMMPEGAPLAALAAILSHFEHGQSTTTDQLDIKDSVLAGLPALLQNPDNVPGGNVPTAKTVEDNMFRILGAFDTESQKIATKRAGLMNDAREELRRQQDATLARNTEQTQNLEKQNAALEEQIAENEKTCHEKTAELQRKIRELEEKISSSQDEKNGLQTRRTAAERALRDHEEELQRCRDQVAVLRQDNDNLRGDRLTATHLGADEVMARVNEVESKNKEIELKDKKIKDHLKEIEDGREEVGHLKDEIEKLVKKIRSLETAVNQNRNSLEEANAQVADVKRKLSRKDEDNAAQVDDINSLRQQLEKISTNPAHECKCTVCEGLLERALATSRLASDHMKTMEARLLGIIEEEQEMLSEEGTGPSNVGNGEELEGQPLQAHQHNGSTVMANSPSAENDLRRALDVGKRLFTYYQKMQQVLQKYRGEKERMVNTVTPWNPAFMVDMDIYLRADVRRLERRRDDLREQLQTTPEDNEAEQKRIRRDTDRVERETEKYKGVLDEIRVHCILADEAIVVSETLCLDPDTRQIQRLLDDHPGPADSPARPTTFGSTDHAGSVTSNGSEVQPEDPAGLPWRMIFLVCTMMIFVFGYMAQQRQKEKWSTANNFSRALWINSPNGGIIFTWVHLILFIFVYMTAIYKR